MNFHKELIAYIKRASHIHGDESFMTKYDKIAVKKYLARLVRRGVLKRPHAELFHF